MIFEMTYFDLVILSIITASSIYGAGRGFFNEILSLLTWVFTFLAVFNLDKVFYPYAFAFIQSEIIRVWVLRLVIAVVVLILGNLVKRFLSQMVRKNFPGNRIFGLSFGLLRSFVFIAFILALIHDTVIYSQSWVQESIFLEFAEDLLDILNYIFTSNT